MKINVPKIGEFEVNDIPYSKARELHKANVKAFWNRADDDPIDPDAYYELLDQVKEMSGLKDKDLSSYKMLEVDQILQHCLMEYTGLNPKG